MQLDPFAKGGLFRDPAQFFSDTGEQLHKLIEPIGKGMDAAGKALDTPIKFSSNRLGISFQTTPTKIIGGYILGQGINAALTQPWTDANLANLQVNSLVNAASPGTAMVPSIASGAQYPGAIDAGTSEMLDSAVTANSNVVPSFGGGQTADFASASLPADSAMMTPLAPPTRALIDPALGSSTVGNDLAWYSRPGAIAESTGTGQAVAETSSILSGVGTAMQNVAGAGLAAGAAILRTIATDPNAAKIAVGVGTGLLANAIKTNETPQQTLAQSVATNPTPWIVGVALAVFLLRKGL